MTTANGTTDGWRGAWTEALDRLELDVTIVEALLTDIHRSDELPVPDPWSPPEGIGPLPLDLRPRADGILKRQTAAAQLLAQALVGTRRQVAAASKVETRDSMPSRPAYLDCAM
ncbi:hypothetical protein [Catenuloplanes japonicus]|uniref:hypothetical protein n=1 Tax=Catenuloplanes japonicus TaxID=33876 RepID=UPI0005253657|nr:hypothetical protein [Catenuloplanes japonicus]